ncbi:Cj0814 family flagellar-dependent secreted protein, partial [Campylobacter concisus]
MKVSAKVATKQTSLEVLGYKVDKDGYFTDEFNKQAGIPSEYKIHSSTLESLVRIETQSDYMQRTFDSIDILKTVNNAYKILSQVVGEDTPTNISITKGGLLAAVINSNLDVKEGETTVFGKKQGFD